MNYNYKEEMKNDILNYLHDNNISLDNYDEDSFINLADKLSEESAITGNGADWYDTEEICKDFIENGNLGLALEAAQEYDIKTEDMLEHFNLGNLFRYLDCIIRCYLLNDCLYELWNEEYGNAN